MAVETTAEEQQRLLEEALLVVRQQFGLMRKCLDTPGKLMDALKCRYLLVHHFDDSILRLVAGVSTWSF